MFTVEILTKVNVMLFFQHRFLIDLNLDLITSAYIVFKFIPFTFYS